MSAQGKQELMPPKVASKEPELKTVVRTARRREEGRGRDYFALLVLAVAIFLGLCLFSYDPRDPSFNVATSRPNVANLCGLVGSYVADALVQILGGASLLISLGLFVLGVRSLLPPRTSLRVSEACVTMVLVMAAAALLERFSPGPLLQFSAQHSGGTLGAFIHGSLARLVGSAGEMVFVTTVILICALNLLKVSAREAGGFLLTIGAAFTLVVRWGWGRLKGLYLARKNSADFQECEDYAFERDTDYADAGAWKKFRIGAEKEQLAQEPEAGPRGIFSWAGMLRLSGEAGDTARNGEEVLSPQTQRASGQSRADGRRDSKKAEVLPLREPEVRREREAPVEKPLTERELKASIEAYLKRNSPGYETGEGKGPEPLATPEKSGPRPITVTKRADEAVRRADLKAGTRNSGDDYELPPLDLLDTPPPARRAIDETLLQENAATLEQKLADLGIKGEVVAIHPGPVITMYELSLASGIPLRRVLNTADDLAMALKSGSTRVVAPIPGKDTVGIEVPNLNREIVYFREIIESQGFAGSSAPLKVALGKCIDGEPIATSLAKMPHLLIAGATGTGKSVGLNCLICSWLMSCHPDDVKFIMVDPKRLELSYYQDIPHLIHPVVTDSEKVPKVLSWAIREMERRYELLSRAGAKNIEGYNQKLASGEIAPEGDEQSTAKLPYLVIIVDELAELMMVAAKDIEISIARLAQMARAAGIHLILATQRPSVDVITGVIKANFPARISYQVSARPDSRTILDSNGAENLLGMGDMLFLPPGSAKLTRIHGGLVSENEIRRIADFCKAQRSPVYLQEISQMVSDDDSKGSSQDLIEDEKYDEAVELVSRLGHASISLIQRHMRIGYNRAARIIEAMEAEGVIGPSDGTSRPREVLARSLASIPD